MKKLLVIASMLFSVVAGAQTGAYNENALAYIRQYKAWAIEEQQRTGVPAAITLAQGIHETQAGTSELATEANNHFGIKCKKAWTGETYTHTDDAPDECFRKYAKAYDSYKDHSDYLKQSARYMHCFELDVTDYAGWARELKAAGYATNPKYAQKLVRIVEDFHLQDYTYSAMKAPYPQGEGLGVGRNEVSREVPAEPTRREERRAERRQEEAQAQVAENVIADKPVATAPAVIEATPVEEYTEPVPVYGQITMRNNLKGFYAHRGDVLLEPAIKYNMRYAKLLELNDLPDAPLEADMFVYTERKRGLGLRREHPVKDGETMTQIAQSEGIQVKQLRILNNMNEGEEPTTGTVLSLQVQHTSKPEVRAGRDDRTASYSQPAMNRREEETIATGHPAVIEATEAERSVTATTTQEQPKAIVQAIVPAPERKAEQIPEEVVAMPVVKPQPTPKPQPETRRTPPPPAPPKQKTYTIADEMAVGEEAPKYSPRYQSQNAPAAANTNSATEQPTANIPAKEEPQDDFSRLKARLDKAVYSPARPVAQTQQTSVVTPKPVTPTATVDAPTSATVHTVKTGETAYSIAKQYNLSMKQLMDMNNLNFEAIKVGQKLRVK